jgi:membrane protein insertase Oxa1/YidC/SpoIIIJ
MMTAFGFFWASGLNLYWFVQNLAAIPQTWLIANERAKAQGTTVAVVSDGGGKSKR